MKTNIQIGFNEITKKYVLVQPGHGQIEICADELDLIVEFACKHEAANSELPKGKNDEHTNEH